MKNLSEVQLQQISGGLTAISSGTGGDGSSQVTQDEIRNASEAAVKEIMSGEFDSEVAGKMFDMVNIAQLAAGFSNAYISAYEGDIRWYEASQATGSPEHAPVDYYIELAHPQAVDWSKYDDGGKATPDQTLMNLFNYMKVHHTAAVDPNYNSQTSTGGAGVGSGDHYGAGSGGYIYTGVGGTSGYYGPGAGYYYGTVGPIETIPS